MNHLSLVHDVVRETPDRSFDMAALAAARENERYSLHNSHLNEQMVRVLQTIGYDVGLVSGHGQYLWDRKGDRYLDLLSGWGVFALGRNHPDIRRALVSVLDADLPNLVQMDVSVLAGILAETMILERCEDGATRFRLAGTRIAEHFGTELRGQSFLDMWSESDASTLKHHLDLMRTYRDSDLHDVTAYLATLK